MDFKHFEPVWLVYSVSIWVIEWDFFASSLGIFYLIFLKFSVCLVAFYKI